MKRRWYWYIGLIMVISWAIFNLLGFRIFTFPLMIAKDPLRGCIYVATDFSILAVGIWLMARKPKITLDKEVDEYMKEKGIK